MAAAARRAQAALLRPALRLSRNANSGKVMRNAIQLVKDILEKELTPKGLTTAEIYKFTQEHTPPPEFKPAHVPVNVFPPPDPNAVVRSPTYLKTWILPVLQAKGLIRMAPVQRGTLPSERIWAWVLDPEKGRNPKVSTFGSPRVKKKKKSKLPRIDKAMNRYRELIEAVRTDESRSKAVEEDR